jgi:hypothetical protein
MRLLDLANVPSDVDNLDLGGLFRLLNLPWTLTWRVLRVLCASHCNFAACSNCSKRRSSSAIFLSFSKDSL